MDPKLAEQLAKGLSENSGNAYIIYALSLFCVSVVIYLIRDHVANNAKLILLVESNTRVLAENNRVMKRLSKQLRNDRRGRAQRANCRTQAC